MKTWILLAALVLAPLSVLAADEKISARSAASTLGGTEVIGCTQGGTDKKCTVTQILAGNAATATLATTATNATTATALAANGANCSAGQFPLGVTAAGAVESCTALPTTITGTANGIAASAATGAVTLSLSPVVDLTLKTLRAPNSATIPATCTVGDSYMDTSKTTGQMWYLCEATDTWVLQGGAPTETQTLDNVFDLGKIINGANSLANAVQIGDGVTPICLYTDATLGPQVRPCTDADVKTIIPANFTWALHDVEGDAAIETVDPDAATVQGMWTYGTAYRPKKQIYFPAGALSTDGTQCSAPAEVTINSGAKRWTIICADNDASTIYGEVEMPDSWDGGTVTLMGTFIQTAADTSNLNADIAMACRVDGDTINNTWGTEIAMDTAMGGSNKIDTVTTAAITPNGTCTGAGTMLQFRYQLDAAGTTTAVATLHHLGFKLTYSEKSRSS